MNSNAKEPIIKPEIICKDERLLLGIARHINQDDNIKFGLLQKVRNEFMYMAIPDQYRISTELFYAVYDYNPDDIG